MAVPPAHIPASIIIVNFNGRSLLDDCLSSVLEELNAGSEVVLVDNGSSDGSAAYVRERYPWVRLLAVERNLGFAGGCNAGVGQAANDVIVLLNNDTIVRPGWLSALVAAVIPEGVGVSSSLVLTSGIPDQYYERNGSLNLVGHNIMRMFVRPENIFYAGGASLAFLKSRLGVPFDADYFAYAEDVYLGLRARFKGYRVVHVNGSVVKHLGGATAKSARPARITMLQERNRLLNILLFFEPGTLIRLTPFLLLNAIGKIGAALVRPRLSLAGVLSAYWWLIAHVPEIRRKKRALQAERVATDADVLSWMTGKLTNGESAPCRLINGLSRAYCALAGLRTLEFIPPGER